MQTDFTGSDSPIHKIFEDFDLGVQASPSHSSRRFSGDSFDLEDSPSSLLDIEEVFFAPKSSSAPPVKSPLPRFEPSKSQKNVADMDLIPRESKDSFPQGPLDIVLGSAGKETAKRGKDNNEDLSSEDVREFSDERHQRHYNEMLMLANLHSTAPMTLFSRMKRHLESENVKKEKRNQGGKLYNGLNGLNVQETCRMRQGLSLIHI
eukprot:TRINITY_DN662_c0_g1_i8.p1 TRINITY_DN662_c0_g1~~TRINITY_DN662_c0_g1_i8.p1  ORF type:complete len:206 (+),score=22.07 TRINITY_DN662_c0_g1_i8:256-873(+)